MSFFAGLGFSQNMDPEKAARDAARQAQTNAGTKVTEFAMVLSTVHYDPRQTLPVIQETLNCGNILGSSTAGVILGHSVYTRGIGILALSGDEVHCGVHAVGELDHQIMRQAGTRLGQHSLRALGPHNRQVFLYFVDGHLQNNTLLLRGLQEVFGNIFPLVGAGSADDFHFKDSFQIAGGRVMNNAAAGVLIGGNVTVGVGSRHGWKPLGKPRTITRAEGNIIRQIDDQKAIGIYHEYFGEQAKELHAERFGQLATLYPLGVFVEGGTEYLLRSPVSIQEDGSIICQGEVPQGAQIHIMIGNKDSCRQAAVDAAEEARENLLKKKAELVLVFESMARLKLLGRDASAEIQAVETVFGKDTPVFGMYAHGEISPFQTVERFKRSHLQNESIVIVAIA